jgi:DNA-binding MarR family transcriptional regulator
MKTDKNYFDALFYASSTTTTKEEFHIDCVQFKVMLKLIHYNSNDKYITWTSENISKHISIPIGSIDKAIQRLTKKGYIKTSTTQIDYTHKKRTIVLNWEKISEINTLYLNSLEESTQVEEKEIIPTIEPEVIYQPQAEEIVPVIEEKAPIINKDNILRGSIIHFFIEDYLEEKQIDPSLIKEITNKFDINVAIVEDVLKNRVDNILNKYLNKEQNNLVESK